MPPAQFISIAEDSGLIVPIGEWAFREACTQARTWQLEGLPPVRMSVNLSARQFRQQDLVARIGEPVDRPWTGVQVRLAAGATLASAEGDIRRVVEAELARLPAFRAELIRGEYPVC